MTAGRLRGTLLNLIICFSLLCSLYTVVYKIDKKIALGIFSGCVTTSFFLRAISRLDDDATSIMPS